MPHVESAETPLRCLTKRMRCQNWDHDTEELLSLIFVWPKLLSPDLKRLKNASPNVQMARWVAYYGPFPDDIRTINIRLPTPQQQPVAGGVFSSIGRNSSKFMTAIQNADSGSLLFSDDFLLTWMSLCHCTSALKTFQKGTHS